MKERGAQFATRPVGTMPSSSSSEDEEEEEDEEEDEEVGDATSEVHIPVWVGGLLLSVY